MLCNAILNIAPTINSFVKERRRENSVLKLPLSFSPLRLSPLFSVHLSFCSLTRVYMLDFTSSKICAQLAKTFVWFRALSKTFPPVSVQCQRVLRKINEKRKRGNFVWKLFRENSCTRSKFMRILNPLMPREVCHPFYLSFDLASFAAARYACPEFREKLFNVVSPTLHTRGHFG